MLLRGVNRHVRYAALKATGDAELLRQTEMKHHPTCTPRPDARAAGVLAESWSSKDSTRGLSLQNCPLPPPPTHEQLQTVRLKPDASSEIRLTAESRLIIMLLNIFFFFLIPSLSFWLFVVSKKKKKKQSSHFTLLSFFLFFTFFGSKNMTETRGRCNTISRR